MRRTSVFSGAKNIKTPDLQVSRDKIAQSDADKQCLMHVEDPYERRNTAHCVRDETCLRTLRNTLSTAAKEMNVSDLFTH